MRACAFGPSQENLGTKMRQIVEGAEINPNPTRLCHALRQPALDAAVNQPIDPSMPCFIFPVLHRQLSPTRRPWRRKRDGPDLGAEAEPSGSWRLCPLWETKADFGSARTSLPSSRLLRRLRQSRGGEAKTREKELKGSTKVREAKSERV